MRAVHTSWLLLILAAGCGEGSDAIYARGLDDYARHDYTAARAPITEAAQAGHPDAQAVLGAMYLYGRGVQKDGREAEAWLLRAAEAGQVDAQSILGLMYITGAGVERDRAKAKRWLHTAANSGDRHAIQMLELLSKRDAEAESP